MKDFLEIIVKKLVDDPESVVIAEDITPDGFITLTISAAQEDIGKIIGKEGKVIKALRDLIKILAVKENKRVTVQIS
ncbi:MAG: KH domain-containing protein [Patescibacteria group bacterium]